MISIIVPIYNVERFLSKCIESLINQSYRDIQIILINDGSTDASGEICDEYAKIDDRISVIHQQNAGVSSARNAGLKIARGEYIGFCDPDDFVAPDMYGSMLEAITRYDADLAACGYNYYSEDYQLDTTRICQERDDEILHPFDLYSKLSDMPPTIRHGVVTKLFMKNLLGNMRFREDLKSAEDAEFLLDYISKISTCVFVHKPFYKNLVRAGSATHGGLNIKSLNDSFSIHDRMYKETIVRFPKLRSKAIAFLMDVCTLKYNESKRKSDNSAAEAATLRNMRRYIKKKALPALLSHDIKWTTKIYYLLLWIRK